VALSCRFDGRTFRGGNNPLSWVGHSSGLPIGSGAAAAPPARVRVPECRFLPNGNFRHHRLLARVGVGALPQISEGTRRLPGEVLQGSRSGVGLVPVAVNEYSPQYGFCPTPSETAGHDRRRSAEGVRLPRRARRLPGAPGRGSHVTHRTTIPQRSPKPGDNRRSCIGRRENSGTVTGVRQHRIIRNRCTGSFQTRRNRPNRKGITLPRTYRHGIPAQATPRPGCFSPRSTFRQTPGEELETDSRQFGL